MLREGGGVERTGRITMLRSKEATVLAKDHWRRRLVWSHPEDDRMIGVTTERELVFNRSTGGYGVSFILLAAVRQTLLRTPQASTLLVR
jgi:hypothetical protein